MWYNYNVKLIDGIILSYYVLSSVFHIIERCFRWKREQGQHSPARYCFTSRLLPPLYIRTKVRSGGEYSTADVQVDADAAKEEAKYESQSTTIITAEDIAKKQAKSVEDIIFDETGMTRSVDAMGRVTVSIRGAEPRHTLILIDVNHSQQSRHKKEQLIRWEAVEEIGFKFIRGFICKRSMRKPIVIKILDRVEDAQT